MDKQLFGTVETFLCLNGRSNVDIAFVPILAPATTDECVAFLKKAHCKILSHEQTMGWLNKIGDEHFPARRRVISPSPTTGDVFVTTLTRPAVLPAETTWSHGDLLMCVRPTMFGMSDLFSKEPFVGERKFIEAETD